MRKVALALALLMMSAVATAAEPDNSNWQKTYGVTSKVSKVPNMRFPTTYQITNVRYAFETALIVDFTMWTDMMIESNGKPIRVKGDSTITFMCDPTTGDLTPNMRLIRTGYRVTGSQGKRSPNQKFDVLSEERNISETIKPGADIHKTAQHICSTIVR